MVGAIRLVAQWWIWIALLFVVLAVLSWRQSGLARRDAKFSIFGLEKEQAQRRKVSSRGRALLMLVLAACVYGLNRYAVPLLPRTADEVEATSVGTAQATAKPSPTAVAIVQFPGGTSDPSLVLPATTLTVAPSPTSGTGTPTPAATEEATATPVPAPAGACAVAGVQISSPGYGASISGAVTVTGTADIADFQFYKLEIAAGEQPGGWSVIGDTHSSPVQGGALGTWDTSSLAAGTYWVRLVVVDKTGNYPSPCAIRVNVAN
jgi:hypothetical protein